jgi:hypothetical protein
MFNQWHRREIDQWPTNGFFQAWSKETVGSFPSTRSVWKWSLYSASFSFGCAFRFTRILSQIPFFLLLFTFRSLFHFVGGWARIVFHDSCLSSLFWISFFFSFANTLVSVEFRSSSADRGLSSAEISSHCLVSHSQKLSIEFLMARKFNNSYNSGYLFQHLSLNPMRSQKKNRLIWTIYETILARM